MNMVDIAYLFRASPVACTTMEIWRPGRSGAINNRCTKSNKVADSALQLLKAPDTMSKNISPYRASEGIEAVNGPSKL